MAKTATRELILGKALELFNEQGIEYTGLRELAGVLGMRVSNISYYFPTKDDLVAALAAQLKETNSAVFDEQRCASPGDFLRMHRITYHNQHRFRCLFLSFVHLITQNPLLAANYARTEKRRKATLRNSIGNMVRNGYLKKEATGKKTELLVSHFALLSRFWLSEARISFPGRAPGEAIFHYQELGAELLRPYATARGKKDLEKYLEEERKMLKLSS